MYNKNIVSIIMRIGNPSSFFLNRWRSINFVTLSNFYVHTQIGIDYYFSFCSWYLVICYLFGN